MAGLDNAKVLIGAPDQTSASGAVLSGAVVETIPKDYAEAETAIASFTGGGFVSEDGLTIGQDTSTTAIKDWSKATVRTLIDEFNGTISWGNLQYDYDSLCQTYGSNYVTKSSDGKSLTVKIGAHMAEQRSWAFKMKDGNNRIIVFVPKGQVVSSEDITLNAGEAIIINNTLNCYDDGTGNSIYIFSKEGV